MVMPRFAPGLEASSFQVLADLGLEYGTFDEPVDVGQLLP
jgi:NitT/TauT family transport system substrate-binding protein